MAAETLIVVLSSAPFLTAGQGDYGAADHLEAIRDSNSVTGQIRPGTRSPVLGTQISCSGCLVFAFNPPPRGPTTRRMTREALAGRRGLAHGRSAVSASIAGGAESAPLDRAPLPTRTPRVQADLAARGTAYRALSVPTKAAHPVFKPDWGLRPGKPSLGTEGTGNPCGATVAAEQTGALGGLAQHRV